MTWTILQILMLFAALTAFIWLTGLILQSILFLILYSTIDTSVWLINKTMKLIKGEKQS